jgi:hypothetical protein
MSAFSDYLEGLGLLHDSQVTKIELDIHGVSLRLEIDDIHSSFLDLPEYPGPESGAVILAGVSELAVQMLPGIDGLSIYEFEVMPGLSGEGGQAEIRFSPGGFIPNPPIIWTTSNGEAATPGSANLPIGIIIKLRSQRSSFIHIIP